jgi:hypothetical protein
MAKDKKSIPFDFAIENLYSLNPTVRPMFGAHAIYIGAKIVLMLRDKDDIDSGVWIATTPEHHASLKKIFKNMRSITLFGGKISGWQLLPMEADDFEKSVNTACEMVLRNDERIGKLPKEKKKKGESGTAPKKMVRSSAKPVKKAVKKPAAAAKKTARTPAGKAVKKKK